MPAFRAWALANGYAEDLTIDRIDNDRGYDPGNCRWVTLLENNRNRPSHNKLSVEAARDIRARLAAGERNVDLAREYGCDRSLISHVKSGFAWGQL